MVLLSLQLGQLAVRVFFNSVDVMVVMVMAVMMVMMMVSSVALFFVVFVPSRVGEAAASSPFSPFRGRIEHVIVAFLNSEDEKAANHYR